ncbi:acetyltransferase [Planctomycetota bacterium]|nr:acetyltransferase [Planctomycetota bacterium]
MAGAEPVVRRLRDDDLPALLRLYAFLHIGATPAGAQVAAETWARICANPDLHYLGVEVDGELVASCTIAIIPNLTNGARSYGLIENVVTHPDHRKRGFGTAVLHAANQIAWEQGCYKVMLMTGRKDAATLRFYASAGFESGIKTAFLARRPAHE